MASFVEQATLRVNDRSTKQIRQINKSLLQLFATTKKLRKVTIGVNFGRAQSQITTLNRSLSTLTRRRPAIRVDTTGAVSQIRNLRGMLNALSRRRTNVAISATGGSGGVRRPGRIGAIGGGGDRPVRLEFGAFRYFVKDEMYNVMRSAIIDGFQAVRSQEVAQARLRAQGMTDEQRTQAGLASRSLSSQFPVLTSGQLLGIISEVMPVVGEDVGRASTLTSELATMIEQQVSFGESVDTATESAIEFAKAVEQSGRMYDRQGNFDPERLHDTFAMFRGAAAQIGKEFTGAFVRSTVKYLRSSKLTVDDRGLALAFLLNEESGSSGSVGFNQAITQLSGTRIQKKQLANLAALGLITSKEVKAGSTSEGVSFTELVGDGAVDEQQLRENILAWVRDRLMPAAKKAGVDTTNPTDIAKFASSISSDRTAIESITTLLVRFNDLNRGVDQIIGNMTDVDTARKNSQESLLVHMNSVQSQFSNVIESVVSSFRDVLIPAASATATALNSLSNFIAGGDMGTSLGVVAGVGAAGIGTAKLGTSLLGVMFNPLNRSALALDGSAAALTRAAVMLGGAGVAAGGAGAPGTGAPRGKRSGGLLSLLPWVTAAATTLFVVDEVVPEGSYLKTMGTDKDPAVQARNRRNAAYDTNTGGPVSVESSIASMIGGLGRLGEDAALRFDAAFGDGAAKINDAATTFGPTAAQGLLDIAPQVGNAIGAAAAAAINNNARVNVNVSAPSAAPNTGSINVNNQ